ncbi:MAG: hypothetical protein L0338_11525, partial [Acidobacteria bacterium]|nr:hypothetical protein [Acidobacteriota bacterium]
MIPSDDPRLEPSFELLGRVSAVNSGELQLEDAREATPSASTSDSYLEPSSHTFNNLIDQLFRQRANQVRQTLFR